MKTLFQLSQHLVSLSFLVMGIFWAIRWCRSDSGSHLKGCDSLGWSFLGLGLEAEGTMVCGQTEDRLVQGLVLWGQVHLIPQRYGCMAEWPLACFHFLKPQFPHLYNVGNVSTSPARGVVKRKPRGVHITNCRSRSTTEMLIIANSGMVLWGEEAHRHYLTQVPCALPISPYLNTMVRIKQGNMYTGYKTRLGTLLSKNDLINIS